MNNHYKIHKPSPLELIERYKLNFIEGNIIKYVLRSPFKGDRVGDLKKALEYAPKIESIGFYREFDESELNQYTELNELEKQIVCSVIQSDIETMCADNYIVQSLIDTIFERESEKSEKKEEKIMTDRIKSLIIHLEKPVKDEEICIEPILNAIKMIKCVAKVEKIVQKYDDIQQYNRGFNDAIRAMEKLLYTENGHELCEKILSARNP